MPLGQLAQVLRGTLGGPDERLLVGPTSVDDAGVVRLSGAFPGAPEDHALVQTVDYFPPVVDNPEDYGRIAAANALSDVYAMGGKPLSALTVAGFPKDFPAEWIERIFRGGFETVRESGAVVAGGHTVQSPEPHFGFSVTGVVPLARVTSNDGAKVGDVGYLTKPLGAGSITTGAKRGATQEADLRAGVESMGRLNGPAAEAMAEVDCHAATDITGFGLVGHTHNIAKASGVTIRLHLNEVPLLSGSLDLARAGVLSGGSKRGRATLADVVEEDESLEQALRDLVFDAETSGGLLIFVSEGDAPKLEAALRSRDLPVHRVAECVEDSPRRIRLDP